MHCYCCRLCPMSDSLSKHYSCFTFGGGGICLFFTLLYILQWKVSFPSFHTYLICPSIHHYSFLGKAPDSYQLKKK